MQGHTITDAAGRRHAVPEHVKVTRNQDRYTKCGSCRSTAAFLFTSTVATVVKISPASGTETRPATWSTCTRHVRINLERAAHERGRTVTRFDPQTRRWSKPTQE